MALKLWNKCNELIYKADNKKAMEQMVDKLRQRIRWCYKLKDILKATERQHWSEKNLQEHLQEDPKHSAKWLYMVERLLRTTKREHKQWPKHSRIMENSWKSARAKEHTQVKAKKIHETFNRKWTQIDNMHAAL
jgi:hypothetical protein